MMSKRFVLTIDFNDGGMRHRVDVGLALAELAKQLPRVDPYGARVGDAGEIAENPEGVVVGRWEIVDAQP